MRHGHEYWHCKERQYKDKMDVKPVVRMTVLTHCGEVRSDRDKPVKGAAAAASGARPLPDESFQSTPRPMLRIHVCLTYRPAKQKCTH